MVSKNIRKQNKVKQSKKNNKKLKGGSKSTNNKSLKKNNNKVMKGGTKKQKYELLEGDNLTIKEQKQQQKLLRKLEKQQQKQEKLQLKQQKKEKLQLQLDIKKAIKKIKSLTDINGNKIHEKQLEYLVNRKYNEITLQIINAWIDGIENKGDAFLYYDDSNDNGNDNGNDNSGYIEIQDENHANHENNANHAIQENRQNISKINIDYGNQLEFRELDPSYEPGYEQVPINYGKPTITNPPTREPGMFNADENNNF